MQPPDSGSRRVEPCGRERINPELIHFRRYETDRLCAPTGTGDVTQRCEVIGNPLANIPAGTYFNPAAYAMPALATGPDNSMVGPPVLGNQGRGAGALTYPHVTNLDLTVTKSVPLGSEKRVLKFQVQAYNALNHPEFNAMNTGIQFNPANNAVSNATAVGLPTGTLPARVMAFSARLQF